MSTFMEQWTNRGPDCTCAPMHMSYRRPCKIHCDCAGAADLKLDGSCRRCGKYPLFHYEPEADSQPKEGR